MNRTSIRRTLYLVAALMIAGGLLLRLLQQSTSDLGLHLILSGHLLILTGIFIHIKHFTEEKGEQPSADKHIRQLNSK